MPKSPESVVSAPRSLLIKCSKECLITLNGSVQHSFLLFITFCRFMKNIEALRWTLRYAGRDGGKCGAGGNDGVGSMKQENKLFSVKTGKYMHERVYPRYYK